ncbi:hypothetical protein H5410_015138 [Solanum commersonii]|uniref:Uncharacterized protein n=1 Tax=Solanum commersonii TaxID=4109 RepID=A0A9J5ZTI2_SOLCO|nr:hypothetical protein H5410_015138 [Solanum commersonii]
MQIQAQQRYPNALTKERFHIHLMVQSFKVSKSRSTLTLTKIKAMHDFTHRFALIFQSTFASAHSKSKRAYPENTSPATAREDASSIPSWHTKRRRAAKLDRKPWNTKTVATVATGT